MDKVLPFDEKKAFLQNVLETENSAHPTAKPEPPQDGTDPTDTDAFCFWSRKIGGPLFAIGSLQATFAETTGIGGVNVNGTKIVAGLGHAVSNGTLFQQAADCILSNMHLVHETPAPTSAKIGAGIIGVLGVTFGAVCVAGPRTNKEVLVPLCEKYVDPLLEKTSTFMLKRPDFKNLKSKLPLRGYDKE